MKFLSFLCVCFFTAFSFADGLTVSEAQEASLKKNLKKSFGTSAYEYVKPLTGGRSGAQMHIISVKDQKYVLRIVKPEATLEGVVSQITGYKVSEALGIGVKLFFTDPQNHLLLLEYVQPNGTAAYEMPEQALEEMASYLKKLYRLPLNKQNVLLENGLSSIEKINFSGLPTHLKKIVKQTFQKVDLAHKYIQSLKPVLSHNDLHTGNLLFSNGRTFLIDWDDYSISNIYQEVASTVYLILLKPSYAEDLLSKVLGHEASDLEKAHLKLATSIMLFSRGFEILSAVPEKDQFTLTEQEFEGLPSTEVIVKQFFEAPSPSVLRTLAWTLIKEVHTLTSDKQFSKALRMVKKSQKRAPRSIQEVFRSVKDKWKAAESGSDDPSEG